MKQKSSKWMSLLLVLVMLVSVFGVNPKTAAAADGKTYSYNGYDVVFAVTSAYEGAFNGEITVTNTGAEVIRDWAMSFTFAHEIQNIWNATVLSHTGNSYVVKNYDWNADIRPGESVSFGFVAMSQGTINPPEAFVLVMKEEAVAPEKFAVEVQSYSDWGTGCTGAMIVKNLTGEKLENWLLSFDYNREIVSISNAIIVSNENGHYVVRNAEYNADIAGNTSVHIGFVAGEGDAAERPKNFTMVQTVANGKGNGVSATVTATPAPTVTPTQAPTATPTPIPTATPEPMAEGVQYKEPGPDNIVMDEATGVYYVNNQLAIVVKEGVTTEQVKALAADMEAEVVGYVLLTGDYQLEFAKTYTLDELKTLTYKVLGNVLVEEAMPDYMMEMEYCFIPNDPAWFVEGTPEEEWENQWNEKLPAGTNWGLEAIHAPAAWEYDGETVNVGVIDSLFDENHEDLAFEETWTNLTKADFAEYECENLAEYGEYLKRKRDEYYKKYEETGDSSDLVSYSLMDTLYGETYHGTHVAGTIAATVDNYTGISGVAKNVKLYGSAVGGGIPESADRGFYSSMGYKYHLANLVLHDCKVINVSMGVSKSFREYFSNYEAQAESYESFIVKLIEKGYEFVIVQAAGNDSELAELNGLFAWIGDGPAKDRIIVVGNAGSNGVETTASGEKVFQGYYFRGSSNYGDRVDVCAPGVDIYSTMPGNTYDYLSGTSMAAPHVSGVAAMCFSVNPKLTGAQVKEIICSTGTVMIPGKYTEEYPMLDAKAAVKKAAKLAGEDDREIEEGFGIVTGSTYMDIEEIDYTDYRGNIGVVAYRTTPSGSDELVAWTTSDKFGTYELLLPEGEYQLKVYLDDYASDYVAVAQKTVEVINGEVVWYDLRFGNLVHLEEITTASGILRDYYTGVALPLTIVEARKGWGINAEEGTEADPVRDLELVDVVTSDENGNYSFELENGYYTIVYRKSGYVMGYRYIAVTPETEKNRLVRMVKEVLPGEEEYRIEIEPNGEAGPTDVRLVGEYADGSKIYIQKGKNECYKDGRFIGRLETKVINGVEKQVFTVLVSPNASYRLYFMPDENDETKAYNTHKINVTRNGVRIGTGTGFGCGFLNGAYRGTCLENVFKRDVVYWRIRYVFIGETPEGWTDCWDYDGYYLTDSIR